MSEYSIIFKYVFPLRKGGQVSLQSTQQIRHRAKLTVVPCCTVVPCTSHSKGHSWCDLCQIY